MTRWFIATKERRAQVLDIAADGVPSAVYNSQLVVGGSAQFWSCWSPDGGTTIFIGGREWGTDSACLWKSVNGGLAWTDAAGDAGSPGELPAPYHGDNCRVRSMYGIAAGTFYAHIEGAGGGNDQVFKWVSGVWSIQRDSAGPGQAPSQMHISPAGFFLGTKYLGWQAASLEWYGWDNFFTGASGSRPLGVWYRTDTAEWFVAVDNVTTIEIWKGTPFVPTEDFPGPGGAGAGTWALEYTFLGGRTRVLDNGSNVLWGDSLGNIYIVLTGTVDGEVWKRNKDTGVWAIDYAITGASAGGIWGSGGEILAGMSIVGSELAAFRTAAGVWSTINLTTLFSLGLTDTPQGIWASSDVPFLIQGPTSPNNEYTTRQMFWRTGTLTGPVAIDVLVIGGRNAIVNDVIQSGFTGTIVANAQNGVDVSLVADVAFFGGDFVSWSITFTSGSTVVETGTINFHFDRVPVSIDRFIGAVDSPYRYEPFSMADLIITGDERAMENNMRNSVMIQRGLIPLRNDLGSRVPLLPFDPNDDVLREEIVAEAERAIAVGEPRVAVDKMVRVYEDDENRAQMAIAYYPNNFVDSESRLLAFPLLRLDES